MSPLKSDQLAQKQSRRIRMFVMILILAGLTALGLLHQFGDQPKPVGVDALCPFGGLEAMYQAIWQGVLLKKIAWSSFVLLGATLVVALAFRRAFCGKICPLGTLQELFGRMGRKLIRTRPTVPWKTDRILRLSKYLVLAAVLVLTAVLGELVFRPYDPWVAWMHLGSPEVLTALWAGLAILILSLAGSVLVDRFFCKYLCPMGAFLGILSPLGAFKIRRAPDTCIDCKACNRICPANLKVAEVQTVKHAECINCDLCVTVCPVMDTLSVQGPAKHKGMGRRINPTAALAWVLGIFALGIGAANILGAFPFTQAPLKEVLAAPAPAQASGPGTGTATRPDQATQILDTEAIKGSNTFRELSELTGIVREDFVKEFGLDEAEFQGQLKAVAHRAKDPHEVDEVRAFVKSRQTGK